MRRNLVLASLVAAALAATVLAQRSDERPERSQRRPADAERRPEPGAPPEMGPDTKLEAMILHPGRVRVRDTWSVGRVECQPWDAAQNAEKAYVRISAVIIRDAEKADDKAAGVELSLEAPDQEHTFVFDAEQIPEILAGFDGLDAAAQKQRVVPQGASRRAVWTLNGLEVGMKPGRTGGYLAPMAPDERSIGLSPDDFGQLRKLLQEARDLLAREAQR